jgi:rRNA processing protein Gar1
MSDVKPLFASVKRLIAERDEIEKALLLDESKFGKWKRKKKKQTRTRPADCDDAIAGLIGDDDAA